MNHMTKKKYEGQCMIGEQNDDKGETREIDEKQTLRTSRSSGTLRRDG